MTMLGLFGTLLLLILYFLPALIASQRGAKAAGTIFLVNFALGWTVLGWIAALIWAVTDKALETKPGAVVPPDQPVSTLPRESGRLLGSD